MAGGFDWNGFERAVTDAVVGAVRAAVRERPARQPCTVAALGEIHREPGGVIAMPRLAMTTVDALPGHPAGDPDWLPEHAGWQRALTGFACRAGLPEWHDAFQRYLTALTQAGRSSRRQLRDVRAVDADFVVLVLDDEHRETLLRRVLPAPELHRLFPDLDRRHAAAAPSSIAHLGPTGALVDARR
ncbi:hypothetical protein Daura_29365 [Dactylosporangium aurantiacum]|uniref:Uncharacterized protein n=1 Tax=Dactylosporangium aurantiacum TaxID=35754 RepID=A0A9Q9MFS7_9ACTN|nr:hypothetical protein [Dactylosporangium aurantiacum]MDG6106763.1 hypothetical protein [Dactylosporangium aurantiacum]UWZ50906.1 hypothetical protein Daura_29365 [Dactylosporangium aurantiacum]